MPIMLCTTSSTIIYSSPKEIWGGGVSDKPACGGGEIMEQTEWLTEVIIVSQDKKEAH